MVTRKGLGGLPRRRPDQPPVTPPGAGPAGASAGIFRGRLVIVSGNTPTSGVFIYNGNPGLNTLFLSIAGPATTADPFGNPVRGGGAAIYAGGQTIFLGPVGGVPELQVSTGAAFELTPANMAASLAGAIGHQVMLFLMSGPQGSPAGANDWVQVELASANQDGSSTASASLNYIDTSGTLHQPAFWNSFGFTIDTGQYAPGDGNNYNLGASRGALGQPGQTISTLADTLIVNLSKSVLAGNYTIEALVVIKANQTGGTATITVHGPALSDGGMGFAFIGGVGVNANWSAGGLAAGGVAMNNGQVTWIMIRGTVTFATSGTLSIQAHTSAIADTFTVQQGSFLEISIPRS